MNEDRSQDRFTKPTASEKRRRAWRQDLNPNHLSRQNGGQVSDARLNAEWTAFHLRKRGLDPGGVNDGELKQVPIAEGDDESQE
jgi:hypothetical protein